jgi:hypothetical protein
MSEITADSNVPRHGGWSSSLRTLFSPSRQSEDLTVDGPISSIELIGETAGHVWKVLDTHGPTELGKLAKEIGAPRDLVVLAVGWLAREEKIAIQQESCGHMISLQ